MGGEKLIGRKKMMIAGKIKLIRSHECIKKNDTRIKIEQYTDSRVKHWYFNIDGKLHGIKYCPYCGDNLYKIGI